MEKLRALRIGFGLSILSLAVGVIVLIVTGVRGDMFLWIALLFVALVFGFAAIDLMISEKEEWPR